MGELVLPVMELSSQQVMNSTQQSQVEELLLPIGDNLVGVDPCYGDDFTIVKREIDRLSDTDYQEIAKLCKKILQKESKDLRVAGYFLISKVFIEGICGLLEGVELYLELVRRYAVSCHPQRANAKAQTIAWLNNEKLSAFVKKIELTNDGERKSVIDLKSLITSLNNELTNLYGDEITKWTSLNPWMDKNLPVSPLASVSVRLEKEKSTQVVEREFKEITSELSFTRSVENLFAYLAKQGDLLRLVSMSRALKWSSAKLPLNEEGLTKIPPPRQSVILAADTPAGNSTDEARLLELEFYYMESGCQFYFDLQKQAVETAISAGRTDVANIIESDLREFIERMPEVVHLSYSDGTPFANELTRRWLRQREVSSLAPVQDPSVTSEETLELMLTHILNEVDSYGLSVSIDRICHIEMNDRSDAFRLDLAKLDLCINAGRADLALHLALQLETQVERYRLAEWDKRMALALWNKLLIILQSVSDNSENYQEKINELKGKICTTDLSFALRSF